MACLEPARALFWERLHTGHDRRAGWCANLLLHPALDLAGSTVVVWLEACLHKVVLSGGML